LMNDDIQFVLTNINWHGAVTIWVSGVTLWCNGHNTGHVIKRS